MGRRGSGKTYLGKQIQTCYPRRVVIDRTNEYTSADGTVITGFDAFASAIQTKRVGEKWCLIFQVDPEPGNSTEEINEVLRVMYHRGMLTGENVQIVLEEVHLFSTPLSMPHWLMTSLTIGRHANQSILVTTQRPGLCHKLIISQGEHVFCGQLHDRNDIEYVRGLLGDRTYSLVDFPQRKFLYFSPGMPIVTVRNSLE